MMRSLRRPAAVLRSLALLLAFGATSSAVGSGRWIGFNGLSNGCDGAVQSIAVHPDGRVAVGGEFSLCGEVPTSRVAIYDPATDSWSGLAGGVSAADASRAEVHALAWLEDELVVGGEFTSAGGMPIAYLARWDGSQWRGFGAAAPGYRVLSLLVEQGSLFVGGDFLSIDGIAATRIARWDGSTWHPLGAGASGSVTALLRGGDGDLYAGGSFQQAGGLVVNGVARWDGSGWHRLGSESHPGVGNGSVFALASWRGELYVGGEFFSAGGGPGRYLARWDGSTWHPVEAAGGGQLDGTVMSLLPEEDTLLAAGGFLGAGSESTPHLARWDGAAWSAVDGAPAEVDELATHAGTLYVGGAFGSVEGRPVHHVARLEQAAWSGLGLRAARGPDTGPLALLSDPADGVLLAGDFGETDGLTAAGVARMQAEEFTPLSTTSSPRFTLRSIVFFGGQIHVAGFFHSLQGRSATNVARLEEDGWRPLGAGLGQTGRFDHWVSSLADWNGTLYAAGAFPRSGPGALQGMAQWDGTQWLGLPAGDISNEPTLRALAAATAGLYVGGSFGVQGNVSGRGNIARWDGTTWSPLGSGLDGPVHALLVVGSDLYAAGSFRRAGEIDAGLVARWDGSAWHALGTGLTGPTGSRARALAHDGERLYVGGRFTAAGSGPADSLAYWHAGVWHAVADAAESGVDGEVYALAVAAERLHVGGRFARAGTAIASGYAQWIPTPPSLFTSGFESAPP